MNSSENPDIVPAPTNFATSDTADGELLKQRITARLKEQFPNLQNVHVTVFGTTVALRGKVSSKDEKQLLLECCQKVPGVIRVVDDVIVAEET